MARHRIATARVYDDPGAEEGTRVLVDRLWPRGLSKDKAHVDEWLKEVAPSTGLRKWYGHDPEKHEEFERRYLDELTDDDHAEAVARLRELVERGPVTLLTATKEVSSSEVPPLVDFLTGKRG
jgi:uncharacterized protein YeaO (DUF488 family)